MTAESSSNGSSTHQNTSISPFRVVPPDSVPTHLPTMGNSSVTSQSSPSLSQSETTETEVLPDENAKFPKRRLIMGGAIVLGLAAIGFIPIPHQVGGDVKLAWRETARQSVYTPIPAVVEQVLVRPGDRVQVGQPMVKLSSRELEREIADIAEKLAQSRQALEQSQLEQVRAQAALVQSVAQKQAVRSQANQVLQRVDQLEQGIVPPEIQQLQVERQRLQQQLQELRKNIDRFKELHRDGAVALLRVEEQESAYRNVERDLAVNTERIELVQRQLREEATRELENVNYQAASVTASQMIVESNLQRTTLQQTIATLETRLQQLHSHRNALTLAATTSGTVITSDLDLLVGKEVRPETALLQIANLSQLTANVEIKEEDLDFVQIKAAVTFRPRQAKLETYNARVEDILYNVEVDATQQKRVATVRVVIENPQERLRPGSSGYAKIFSEWIPLYKRVQREVLKLIPERFL